MQKDNVVIQEGQLENVLAVAFAPIVALIELIKNSSDACIKQNDKIQIHIDTTTRTIRLVDHGHGFTLQDITHLHTIGLSTKMREGNTTSRIGEPFAGSKGLGILTAFNLCDLLEIVTFSQEDQKAYRIMWRKGTAEIEWEEVSVNRLGTELILHDVKEDIFRLILLKEELTKLYFSSIKSCIAIKSLPKIELFNEGVLDNSAPHVMLEELYKMNKKARNGFFIAKASFKYSKNKLTVSYEDNLKGLFNIQDDEIDLTDLSSVLTFLRTHKISGLNLKDEIEHFDSESVVDDFSGVYYIWRGSKDAIKDYPYGVRIYINNYGLYNYLNSEFDWLQHSEISQNKKATNYKLKNTYGYVVFHNYNEYESSLKISNERNDFIENLAKKKFIFIMRKFVSAIFSTIDMNIKNFDDSGAIIFKKRVNAKNRVVLGHFLTITDLISTNLSFEEIKFNFPENVTLDEYGNIYFSRTGHFRLNFEYDNEIIVVDVDVESNTPFFELKKTTAVVSENNTYDLRGLIKISTLRNLSLDDIIISSDTAKILNDGTLASNNPSGHYMILYKYSDEVSKTAQITIKPIHYKETDKLKKYFTQPCLNYPKISDIIYAIAESYIKHSTLCMIAMRPLVEFALKAFIHELYPPAEATKIFDDEKKNNSFGVVDVLNGLFQRIRTKKLTIDPTVLAKYEKTLIDDGGHICKAYKKLDLNSYVHSPNTHATPNEVKQFLKKLQPFLNFVIEALNAKDKPVL